MTTKTTHPGCSPWLAATLLLAALAACGGNSGDSAGTGASSNMQTKAPGEDASPAATTTPAAEAAGAAAGSAAPISQTGLRGDVLAQALRTITSQANPADANQPLPTRAWPTSYRYPEVEPDKRLPLTSFFTDHQISADEGKTGLGAYVSTNRAFTMPSRTDGKITYFGVEWRLGLSDRGNLPAALAQDAADAEALQLGARLPLTVIADPKVLAGNTMTVTSDAPYSIRRNAVFEWHTPLHSWSAENDRQRVDLLVINGAKADEFGACFMFNVTPYLYKRRHCSLWQVPAGWAPGQPLVYQGQYVLHLTRYANNTATIDKHWISDPQAIHGKAELHPPADPLPPPGTPIKADAPISHRGISGGVLATMLDAMSPRGNGAANLPPFAAAAEGEIPDWASDMDMFNSKPASLVREPRRVSLQQLARATQYADGAASGAYAPATGNYLYLQRTGAWRSEGDPMSRVFGHAVLTLAVHMSNERNGDNGSLLLSRWLGMRDQGVDKQGQPNDHSIELRGISTEESTGSALPGDLAGSRRYAHDQLVPYGTVHDWRFNNMEQQVQLTVNQHRDANRRPLNDHVQLCWEIQRNAQGLPALGRMVCTVWQIPAGWAYGQPLAPQSFHMFDYSPRGVDVNPARQVWSSTVQ
ncbi:MAG: hypothetical protein Q4B17_00470 [Lautropia sp.]|nr:hypothetical protein [Lautropia sp.]